MNLLEKHCREQAEYQLGLGADWPEAVFTGATGCRLNISSQHKNFRKL
jgi:hypothetical protein